MLVHCLKKRQAKQVTETFKLNVIGYIRSGFREKFGIPRQPGLVNSMESVVEMLPAYSQPDAYRALQDFSHIWVIFVFHQSLGKDWHNTVRPPRLGGNARVGVFASRSPFRPSPIGISAVELLDIEFAEGHCRLHIRGADIMDGTPVLDIKPYIPYSDSLNASSGYAVAPGPTMQVEFSDEARRQVSEEGQRLGQPLENIIHEVLSLDPRPAYQADTGVEAEYGIRLFDFNIRFRVHGNRISVQRLEPVAD